MPFVGEVIPLSFQLLDQDASKFCRAVLSNPAGTTFATVSMVNLGGGKYTNDTVLMPNEDYVECQYQPFNDAGFTIPDPDHLVGTDVFRQEIPDTVIVDLINQILNKLNGLSLPGAAINARIVQNRVAEIVEDTQTLKALVEHRDLKTIILNKLGFKAKVSDNNVNAKVKD